MKDWEGIIKFDKDGTPLIEMLEITPIIMKQDMIVNNKGVTELYVGKLTFEADKYGNVILPKQGEEFFVCTTHILNEKGEWEEVIDDE